MFEMTEAEQAEGQTHYMKVKKVWSSEFRQE